MALIDRDETWRAIKPFVAGLIDDKIADVASSSGVAVAAHDLGGRRHTGTLTNSQAPQFLLRDGSRSLTGNLAVGSLITIDGVDIDVFKSAYDSHIANPDAHHLGFVGLTADSGSAAPNGADLILIAGGNGLASTATGSTVTLNLDTPSTLTVATTNATATGHTHAITSSSAPGAAASLLASDASGQLTLAGAFTDLTSVLVRQNADTQPRLGMFTDSSLRFGPGGSTAPDMVIRRSAANTLIMDDNGLGGAVDLNVSRKGSFGSVTTGTAILNATNPGGEQLRLAYDVSNYAGFAVGAGGNLTLTPTGDVIFDPVGNDILPQSNYDLNLGQINKKYLTLHAAELWVETLVAQDTIATIGGRILVGPTTQLTADVITSDTTISVKHNQLRAGDVAYLEANGKVEFLSIVSGPTGSGPYSYTVTRNLDGTGANAWNAGDAIFNTGQAGSGFLDLYSLAGVNGMLLDAIHAYSDNLSGTPFEGGTYGLNQAQGNTFQLFNSSMAVNDSMYFGLSGATWNNIYLSISTAASWTGVTTIWEYWNGSAWTTFSPTITGAYTTLGNLSIEWTAGALTSWASKTINGTAAYWVRNRVTAVTSVATYPRQGTRRVYWRKRTIGPTIVGNVRNSTTYNDWSEHWAMGNLNGLYDYGNDAYGFAAGKYTGSGGTTPWIAADATNGFRVMRGSTKLGQWDTSGNITVGQVASGQGNLFLSSGAFQTRINTTVKLDAQSDGDLFIGSNTASPSTTHFSIFANVQTYNGESMASGDVLFGDNSASKANIKWTPANGRMNFRGGTTTQLYIATDGSLSFGSGAGKLDSTGMQLIPYNVSKPWGSSASQIRWTDTNIASYIYCVDQSMTMLNSVSSISFDPLITIAASDVTEGLTTTIDITKNSVAISSPTTVDALNVGHTGAASGQIKTRSLNVHNFASDSSIELGSGGSGNRNAFMDFVGDTTYSDYGLRIIRGNGGANADTNILHRGTGGLYISAVDAGPLALYTSSAQRLHIDASGWVGIGVAGVPGHRVTINGATSAAGSYALVVRNSGGGNLFYAENNGALWANSAWTISDKREKKSIRNLSGFHWDAFMQLRPVEYIRKISGLWEVGLIAQETQHIPYAVTQSGMDERLGISQMTILTHAIAAIQDLRATVSALIEERGTSDSTDAPGVG